MPQAWGSATGVGVGNPGYCVFSWHDSTGAVGNIALSFNPTLCKIVQFGFHPLQHVNTAVGGQTYVFQLSTNEILNINVIFESLPWQDSDANPEPTAGFESLLSFIRTTINYHQEVFTVLFPDGQVETVRYIGGIDAFQEAGGRAQRAQRWDGTINVTRNIT
jgi:hypothetical protein